MCERPTHCAVGAPSARHDAAVDAEELYRLPPEQFTAARDAEAGRRKADGDKDGAAELKALRRPSVAAWLLNRLADTSPELLGGLLELGPGLAQAQATGDAAALRSLGAQRRQLVEAVTGAAVAAGGRPVTAAVREEVAGTLEAALSDPASAEAVRSGRLVRSLSYAGFGEVDLSDAVAPAARAPAAPRPGPPPPQPGRRSKRDAAARAREQHGARLAEAQQAANDAAGRLDDAVRARESAERARSQAQEALEALAAEVERRAAALAEARSAHERAGSEAALAQREADKQRAKVERAQARAEAARAELDRLRRDGPPPS